MKRLRLDTSLELLLERLAASESPGVIATIVATTGSTYRKAGARMLIEADGTTTGLLSGGCLEQDLRERALGVQASGTAQLIGYDTRGDDDLVFGVGSGCEGAMRILLEPARADSRAARALAAVGARSRAGLDAALALITAGSAGALGTHAWPELADDPLAPALAGACAACITAGENADLDWIDAGIAHAGWIQYLASPPWVLVCGAGPDAELVVGQLAALRFRLTVIDHRPAYAKPGRFAGATVHAAPAAELARHVALEGLTAAIVMSHHLPSDAAYLAALAASAVPYVGLLGPRPRRERLLGEIGAPAVARLRGRLRGPVGLDLGAVTPEGIALAVAAELHAFAAGRDGGPCSRTVGA
jgi:xanthine dehydrogenase accessory factor